MATKFPPVPAALKAIQNHLKLAAEHDQRDPVISYWCRLYALQTGMKIDRKSKESVALLSALMDWLEKQKKELAGNEAVTNDVVAQAHLENYALKLFLWADTEDRASRFNKNVVKTFYTAGMLFDVLSTFGELTDEVVHHRKYAKWKATYIHNCLTTGEVPLPGPQSEEDADPFLEGASGGAPDLLGGMNIGKSPMQSTDMGSSRESNSADPAYQNTSNVWPPPNTLVLPGMHAPPSTPAEQSSNSSSDSVSSASGGVHLKAEDFNKAQKYCKFAGSALQYEDASTAITNLQKALRLLTTGRDE